MNSESKRESKDIIKVSSSIQESSKKHFEELKNELIDTDDMLEKLEGVSKNQQTVMVLTMKEIHS